MPPKRVRLPVAVTSITAVPRTSAVPPKNALKASAGDCRGARAGPLVDGKGFSGEQGLVGLRAGSLKHDAVGRNKIAGGKLDDIARYQFLDRRFAARPSRRTAA